MTTFRTASPPSPPDDWLDRLRDYGQVKNLLNGDTLVGVGIETPVAARLAEFLNDPEVRALWDEFNGERPGL